MGAVKKSLESKEQMSAICNQLGMTTSIAFHQRFCTGKGNALCGYDYGRTHNYLP